ncbi:MAG: tRNA (adenosine(37)-N6)-threonylcarbamoyltransferase complex dimerization subunit type 1 TsaB [Phycisphaerae bacterium]
MNLPAPDANSAHGLLFAIETSTLAGSLALFVDGVLRGECSLPAQQRRTGALFPQIQALFAEAGASARDVKICAYSEGPGSFTGLRIAATIARMLALTSGCRVVAVPSLAVIAANALPQPVGTRIAVGVDARRGELYSAVYEVSDQESAFALQIDENVWLRETLPVAIRTAESLARGAQLPIIGIGAGINNARHVFADAQWQILDAEAAQPVARTVGSIGGYLADRGAFCATEQIVPRYVRPPECEEVFEQRRTDALKRHEESRS